MRVSTYETKNPTKRVFIETDASDVGWGAVCYQFEDCISSDTLASSCCDDKGNYRLKFDMKKPKRVIEWISKAWTATN